MTEGIDVKPIAGFWRRVGGFVIDSIILGLVGLGLGLFFEREFVQLGGWGRCVGFFIALLYFGLSNSHLLGGQTVGKKLVKIRVVGAGNKPISVIRSFARFTILGVPFFLNGAQLSDAVMTSFWSYPLSVIVFGGLISIVYLLVFNRTTRQSLHDLAVGTYVVRANTGDFSAECVWRPHFIVVGVLFFASAVLPLITANLGQSETFKGLMAAQAALSAHPAVAHVGVSSGTNFATSTAGGSRSTKYLSARVFLRDDTVTDAGLARELAVILAISDSSARQMDIIEIVLSYGYDIGIASAWSNGSHAFAPKDVIGDT